MRRSGSILLAGLLFLTARAARAQVLSGDPCPGYYYSTDGYGNRHYHAVNDPNEIDLGPTCPANGGGTPTGGGSGGIGFVTYAVQVVADKTFTATGQKAGGATVTVTNRNTGIAVAKAFVSWTINEWTYRSPNGQADDNGQFKIYFGHVRPASVYLQADAGDVEGQILGSGSAMSQGVEPASVTSTFLFSAPAAGKTYACRLSTPSTDWVPAAFNWNTYKWSPLGFLAVVSGPPGSGAYWYQDNAPASGFNSYSVNSCQFPAGTNHWVGTLYVRYYTLNGPLSYAAAARNSNTFTCTFSFPGP